MWGLDISVTVELVVGVRATGEAGSIGTGDGMAEGVEGGKSVGTSSGRDGSSE